MTLSDSGAVWRKLAALPATPLKQLFEGDPKRVETLTRNVADIR